jgi:hypothetical protein
VDTLLFAMAAAAARFRVSAAGGEGEVERCREGTVENEAGERDGEYF